MVLSVQRVFLQNDEPFMRGIGDMAAFGERYRFLRDRVENVETNDVDFSRSSGDDNIGMRLVCPDFVIVALGLLEAHFFVSVPNDVAHIRCRAGLFKAIPVIKGVCRILLARLYKMADPHGMRLREGELFLAELRGMEDI